MSDSRVLVFLLALLAVANSACGGSTPSVAPDRAIEPAATPTEAPVETRVEESTPVVEPVEPEPEESLTEPEPTPSHVVLPTPGEATLDESMIVEVVGPDVDVHVLLLEPTDESVELHTHDRLHSLEMFDQRHGAYHELLFEQGYSYEDIHGTPEFVVVDVDAYCAQLAGVLPLDRDNRPADEILAANATAAVEFAPIEHWAALLDIAEANRNPASDLAVFDMLDSLRPILIYGLTECEFEIPGVRLAESGDYLIYSRVPSSADQETYDEVADTITDAPSDEPIDDD